MRPSLRFDIRNDSVSRALRNQKRYQRQARVHGKGDPLAERAGWPCAQLTARLAQRETVLAGTRGKALIVPKEVR
jgi:hypothetical protein